MRPPYGTEKILAQDEELNRLSSGMTELVASQKALFTMMEDSSRLLHERLEAVDDRKEMGRALVEQKARNLELERQNYRLREDVRTATQTMLVRPNELLPVRNLVQSLSNSRMLKLISIFAPKALRTVMEISVLLDQKIAQRNSQRMN